jgi:putative PIN family toxin of toxin-antitoxin system
MIVIDTNVLVSGLLTPEGVCARVVDWALTEPERWLVTFALLEEYRHVLHRPQFKFARTTVDELVWMLACSALDDVTPLAVKIKAADHYDVMFYSVAVRYGADALVTGNRRHYPREPEVPVLSPRQFAERAGIFRKHK